MQKTLILLLCLLSLNGAWGAADGFHHTSPGQTETLAEYIGVDRHVVDNGVAGDMVSVGAGGVIQRLAKGTDGNWLKMASGLPTWAEPSITLGTQTTGSYVYSLVQGSGISLTQEIGEGHTPTVAHYDGSSVANTANTNGSVVQSLTFDAFGHVDTHASTDLDTRYYTRLNLETSGNSTVNWDNISGKPNMTLYYTKLDLSTSGGATVDWDNIVNEPDFTTSYENRIVVAKSGGDYTTIQAAIDAAEDGDLVEVMPGTYTEQITMKRGVTVKGAGRSNTIITTASAGVYNGVIILPVDAVDVLHPPVLMDVSVTNTSTAATATQCVSNDETGGNHPGEFWNCYFENYNVAAGYSRGQDTVSVTGAQIKLRNCDILGGFDCLAAYSEWATIDMVGGSIKCYNTASGAAPLWCDDGLISVQGALLHTTGQYRGLLNTGDAESAGTVTLIDIQIEATNYDTYPDGRTAVTGDAGAAFTLNLKDVPVTLGAGANYVGTVNYLPVYTGVGTFTEYVSTPNLTGAWQTAAGAVGVEADGDIALLDYTRWDTAYNHSAATSNVHGLTYTKEGAGGGLDADTVDGNEASAFATRTGWLTNNGNNEDGGFSILDSTGTDDAPLTASTGTFSTALATGENRNDAGFTSKNVAGDALAEMIASGYRLASGGYCYSTSGAITVDPVSGGSGTLNLGDSGDGDIIEIEGEARMMGTTSNITIGSNYVSGDGGDEGIYVDSTGKVGMGVATQKLQLTVDAAQGSPAVSGTTQGGIFRIGTIASGNGTSLDFGKYAASPYGAWLQATNSLDLSYTYPIVINPNGGNVGIGADTSPDALLDVTGAGQFDSTLTSTYLATGANEYLATDILRHTITAGEAAAHAVVAAWNKATTKKVAALSAITVDEGTANDPVYNGNEDIYDVDVSYDGTNITVTEHTVAWAENDIVTIMVTYEN